jgi:hypothetical protein
VDRGDYLRIWPLREWSKPPVYCVATTHLQLASRGEVATALHLVEAGRDDCA